MPVDPALNAPPSAVLAYNGDSPRGWNDPPTFAFSGNKSVGSRPKLDLRKRVSHQQALHGNQTPPLQPSTPTNLPKYGHQTPLLQPSTPTNLTKYGPADATNGMAELSLQSTSGMPRSPSPQPYLATQPPNSSHTLPSASRLPDIPPYNLPAATPATKNGSSTPAPPPVATFATVMSTSTLDATTSSAAPVHLGQPLFALKSHTFEPVKAHSHGSIRSTAEINDSLDHHDHSDLAMPQIFHPIPHASINPPGSTATVMPPSAVNRQSQAVCHYYPSLMPNQLALSSTSIGQVTPPATTTLLPQPLGCVSPAAVTTCSTASHTGNVTPPPSQLPKGHITPPPSLSTAAITHRTPTPPHQPPLLAPPGACRSAGSTPRCLSPQQSDNSEGSDEEALKATMDALDDVIQKYQKKMEKRIFDDIARRLKIMSQMWMEEKLSKMVKSRMTQLAKALDDGKGEEAHHIHVTIMVDHVAEVSQWMVAVKRLISLVRHDPIRPTSS